MTIERPTARNRQNLHDYVCYHALTASKTEADTCHQCNIHVHTQYGQQDIDIHQQQLFSTYKKNMTTLVTTLNI